MAIICWQCYAKANPIPYSTLVNLHSHSVTGVIIAEAIVRSPTSVNICFLNLSRDCSLARKKLSMLRYCIKRVRIQRKYRKGTSIRQAPVFRHLRALRKSPWKLLSGWMNYNYTVCCWFPTSSITLILPSQFWQIRFESCWLHCSKCRILVLLRYMYM